MNFLYKALACFALVLAFASGSYQEAQACDRALHVLDSIVYDGTNYTIYTTACVGAGVLGGAQGGDNYTATVALAIFSASPTFQALSFGPPSITSDTLNCNLTGFFFNGAPLIGEDTLIGYADFTSSCATGYACTHSTAICGRPHSQCDAFFVVVNEIPDSIRFLGAEATGNPIAGCYPNPNMVVDLTTLPVTWGGFEARKVDDEVYIDWSTLTEANTDYFQVLRAGEEGDWSEIARLHGAGNSNQLMQYSFVDDQPLEGRNHYRIVQYDLDGRFSRTEIATVQFEYAAQFAWEGVGPVPVTSNLNLRFKAPQNETLHIGVYDLKGQQVLNQAYGAQAGANLVQLDFSGFASGTYFVRLKGQAGILSHKVLKN